MSIDFYMWHHKIGMVHTNYIMENLKDTMKMDIEVSKMLKDTIKAEESREMGMISRLILDLTSINDLSLNMTTRMTKSELFLNTSRIYQKYLEDEWFKLMMRFPLVLQEMEEEIMSKWMVSQESITKITDWNKKEMKKANNLRKEMLEIDFNKTTSKSIKFDSRKEKNKKESQKNNTKALVKTKRGSKEKEIK